jgi:hypothetical protein
MIARAFLLSVVAAGAALAQSKAFQPPRTPQGKPDFSGTYEWPKDPGGVRGRGSATIFDRKNFPPFKPGGEPFYEARNGDPKHDEPRDFCMPAGFPAGILSANAMQFFQTKDYLVMVHEFMRQSRIIPLDGRPHREGQEPSFYGDPVGHWEGDTLVIETTNFKRWALDDFHYTDPDQFRMHSDAVKFTERISWKDAKTLNYHLTVDDPKIFTQPFGQMFEIKSMPEWDKDGLYEYVCEENNRCPGGKCSIN